MKRWSALLLAAVTACAIAGCGTQDPPAVPTTDVSEPLYDPTPPDSSSPTKDVPSHGSDSGRTTPQAKPGRTDAAVASVCEAFITGYAEFSPFDFEPAQDWQDRWSEYATPAFIGYSQLTMNQRWAWTWQTARKAFDVRILQPGVVTSIDGDRNRRAVLVHADRLILGINDTGDKARTQKLTFVCDMKLTGTTSRALVDGVEQSLSLIHI